MGSCTCCSCTILCCVANIYAACAVILITLGCYAHYAVEHYGPLVEHRDLTATPNLSIAAGSFFIVVIVLFAIAACLDYNNRKWILLACALVQLLCFVLGLSAILCAHRDTDDLEGQLAQGMNETLHHYSDSQTELSDPIRALDKVQTDFECCGVHSYEDWKDTISAHAVPDSCCHHRLMRTGCSDKVKFNSSEFDSSVIHIKGCHVLVSSEIQRRLNILFYFLFPIIIINAAITIGSFCTFMSKMKGGWRCCD